ncbi:hypothetical protein ACFYP4_02455 [Streptomyces sp. NPDC005551]|uniref:hypothetical protein n=1 Tax=Streptomyces sp. NPDC005551 TaxID=3364725 RepID=UPI00369D287E
MTGDASPDDTSWITDEVVRQAQEYENDAWASTQFYGIPRCVAFPYSGPCCGKYDENGELTGFCPPPHERD